MSEYDQLFLDSLAVHQHALRERLQYFLKQLHPVLYADVMRALEEPGKLYADKAIDEGKTTAGPLAGLWSLLTFLIAQYISPEIDVCIASTVAVAIECFVCAADLLDDIEDEDQKDILRELGIPRALNVTSVLLILTQQIIVSLAQQGVASEQIIALLKALEATALASAAGQHLDLLAEKQAITEFTLEKCIDIAERKSGTLMSLPFQLGALCASADDEICKKFAELGKLLGIAHQLDNDSHDLYYLLQDAYDPEISAKVRKNSKTIKTDLVRGKKTLPIVLFAQQEKNLQETRQSRKSERAEVHLSILQEAILTTSGISLLYRERAYDRVRELENQQLMSPVLRHLLRL